MKASDAAKILAVITRAAETLGPVTVERSGDSLHIRATSVSRAGFFVAGPYAGEPLAAFGDRMIACVNAEFPSARFMSDAERATR